MANESPIPDYSSGLLFDVKYVQQLTRRIDDQMANACVL